MVSCHLNSGRYNSASVSGAGLSQTPCHARDADVGPLQPREKLFSAGIDRLTDAECLALLIGSGHQGQSAVQIGQGLLQHFGGLRALFTATHADCLKVRGLGKARLAQLLAARELGRRCLAERLVKDGPLDSPDRAGDYLRACLQDSEREIFVCVYLDVRHRVLIVDELFAGTIDGATVHPREVVRAALLHNAAAIIVAHNHPSGIAEPSQADIGLTTRLRDALAMVDIRLLDHLVIGDGEVVSLASRGLI